uniref:Phosphatidic acid phosphatase type 2/haloperoxidase domain-containing protein n=1 Tax=Amphora coffeiformis TaxID=265554 RepID=A0A7S3LAB1_9STRA|mmetsp:Transcript_9179/g.18476  ORF Transcript_9179/g.18476 Transcript_9179/m.18476 type:complete len:310 (+) Transcript_9179:68-997(+)
MNSEEGSSSSSYGLAEGESVDLARLTVNVGSRNITPSNDDGIMPNDLAVAERPYCGEKFYELLICISYLVVSSLVMYGLQFQPHERPIPYQLLESSGEFVRNLVNNESFEHETVSFLALAILGLWIPFFIQIGLCFCGDRRKHDIHATLCVYLVAMSTTSIATEAVKLYVGYLRPIFYEECEPNDTYQECTADTGGDLRKSFPSGHASMSFCGLTLLTLFIHARFGVASQRYYQRVGGGRNGGRWMRETIQVGVGWARFASILALLPMGLAIFIAASRVVDNKHFPADIIAGSILGSSISVYVHGLWFD